MAARAAAPEATIAAVDVILASGKGWKRIASNSNITGDFFYTKSVGILNDQNKAVTKQEYLCII